jgi:hypothetical protein
MPPQAVEPKEVGRTCPFCRFPLKEGLEAYRCDTCGALHHADCWQEGRGCAVFGCASAESLLPSESALAAAAPPASVSASSASAYVGATIGDTTAKSLARDDWIVLGLSLLLALDLIALPWFDMFGVSLTATGAPNAWSGVLGLFAALAVASDLAVERFSPQTTLPTIGGTRASTRLVFAGVAGALIALKFVLQIQFSLFGIGFWGAILLGGGLVFSTFKLNKGLSILREK